MVVKLGIEIYIADMVGENGKWFDMDDHSHQELAWKYLYKEVDKCGQGTIISYGSDYFKELEITETTELNDIYETYFLMDKLTETERDIARHIYDSGEWSGSLNDLLKLLSER